MLEPKTIFIPEGDKQHCFIIHKFPATVGREILSKYPASAIALFKQWEDLCYTANEAVMLKVMGYVQAVTADGTTVTLSTKALVDNHVPNAVVLIKLEKEVLEYNFSFFGQLRNLSSSVSSIPSIVQKVIGTLTDSLASLSPQDEPPTQS